MYRNVLRVSSLCVPSIKRMSYTPAGFHTSIRFLFSKNISSMNCHYIASIDQGTSSTRVSLYNSDGLKVFSHQVKIPCILPQPGWVEMEPQTILNSCYESMSQVAKFVSDMGIFVGSESIEAIGITNQRETTLIWDKYTGKALYNAIVWSDVRNSSIVSKMESVYGDLDHFKERTGLKMSTYSSVFKVIWLIENVPEVKRAIEEDRAIFGTVETWLIWNLTGGTNNGVHVTDVTNASRTMLLNLNTLNWDELICNELNFPIQILPQVKSNCELFGKINFGNKFWENVPITGSLGDQNAAMIGLECFERGSVKITCGTGCFVLCNTGDKMHFSKNLITTVSYKLGSNESAKYALEGPVAAAGASMQWLSSNLGIIDHPDQIDDLANSVPDNGGVFFVPAFTGLLAPWWDPTARGLIIGLNNSTNKAHIARAVIEAIAFQCADILPEIQESLDLKIQSLKLNGGMSNSKLLLKTFCDYLEMDIYKSIDVEATSLGAAYAAAKTVGFVINQDNLLNSKFDIEKHNTKSDKAEKLKIWRKAVLKSLKWESDNK